MASRSILDLATAFRRGAARPSNVLDALLTDLHAGPTFRFVTAERARAQAAAADARFACGRPRGFLDGVPIALKD
ncbi:MAG: amidase family protein, partial [Trueperaceae bacterium]